MENLNTAIQNANIYYIHLNHLHIGNRANNIKLNLQQQKENIKTKVINQYKEYLSENIKTDGITLQALAATLDLTQEQLISKLDKDLGEKLQKEINIQKLSNLHQLVKKGKLSYYINNCISEDGKNITTNVGNLKNALQIVAACLNLLDNQRNGSLGAILLQSLENAQSFSQIGNKLQNLLERYKDNNNNKVIKRESIKSAKNMLDNLSYVLQNNKFKSGTAISASGLSRLILNNLISTSIAEGLGFVVATKSENLLYKATISSVGTAKVETEDYSFNDNKITGKRDIKIGGVNYNLEFLDQGENLGSIKLDIGISSKFYTGQKFADLSEKDGLQSILSTNAISSGSGGTLAQAINSIFDSPIDKYLIYNYYAHGNTSPYKEELRKMNDLILKRQILRLFSSAGGGKDFNQFMLINGQIISIWDILQYALNSDLLLSASQQTSEAQGLVLSIPDRPKIIQANTIFKDDKKTQIQNAWERSEKVNHTITTAKIKAKLHLKILAGYYNKKN